MVVIAAELVVVAELAAAAVVAVAVVAAVAASHLCLQEPLGLGLGPRALAFHQAEQRGHGAERDLSFHEAEAFQSPLVLAVDLYASCAEAWDEAASKEIVVNEVEAFLVGAGVGSGQVGHQEDQWMGPGAQLQDQVQLLEYQEVRQAGLQEG